MGSYHTLDKRLDAHARFTPDKPAIIYERSGTSTANRVAKNIPATDRIGYRDFVERIEKTATCLHESWQLVKGDRIAWLGFNHPDMFVLIAACAKLGIVIVPLNWRLSVGELQYIIADCQPAILFCDSSHFDKACLLQDTKDLSDITESDHSIVTDNSSVQFRIVLFELPELVKQEPPELDYKGQSSVESLAGCRTLIRDFACRSAEVAPDDPLFIVYTSGTTGRPKGAVLSHRAVDCNAGMSQHMYDLLPEDRVLNVLPLFHVGGINIQPLPALLFGATLILHETFNADDAVAALSRHRVTLINSVPTILQAILATEAWQAGEFPALKSVSIGSTDVPRELIDAVQDRGVPLVQVYGATETGPIAIYQKVEDSQSSAGSIGKVGLLCEVRLVDDTGREVAIGESGEIHVCGDNLLSAYWNNPEASKKALVNGWFKTGDIASVDDDGNYWFKDRLNHVIISGGENIYPAEIERVIRSVQGVREVSVVGRADPVWGKIPVAVVALEANLNRTETEVVQDLNKRCSSDLAKFKQPRDIIVVNALPRNAMGKIVVNDVETLTLLQK